MSKKYASECLFIHMNLLLTYTTPSENAQSSNSKLQVIGYDAAKSPETAGMYKLEHTTNKIC